MWKAFAITHTDHTIMNPMSAGKMRWMVAEAVEQKAKPPAMTERPLRPPSVRTVVKKMIVAKAQGVRRQGQP